MQSFKTRFIEDTTVDTTVLQQRSHEDVCVAVTSPDFSFRFYGVYDGHGASKNLKEGHIAHTLKYGYKNLLPFHAHLKHTFDVCMGDDPTLHSDIIVRECITSAFVNYDRAARSLKCYGGACASMIIILSSSGDHTEGGKHVYVCNLGDSRVCIWLDKGKIIYQTRDHTPYDEEEFRRVVKSDGFVQEGRVNGSLAVTRAFGDWNFKRLNNGKIDHRNGPVTVIPEIKCLYFPPSDMFKYKFMVTSDGAYEGGANCEYLIETGEILEVLDPYVTPSLTQILSATSTDDITIMIRSL